MKKLFALFIFILTSFLIINPCLANKFVASETESFRRTDARSADVLVSETEGLRRTDARSADVLVSETEGLRRTDARSAYVHNTATPYHILISIRGCWLKLYQRKSGALILVKQYLVGTVKEELVRKGEFTTGKGKITAIELHPSWIPLAKTRHHLATKYGIILPPGTVPYGHRFNFMGEAKISLSHKIPGKGDVVRIHGCCQVWPGDESTVGMRISGGCFRMYNEEIIELAKIVSVGTPVEIAY